MNDYIVTVQYFGQAYSKAEIISKWYDDPGAFDVVEVDVEQTN